MMLVTLEQAALAAEVAARNSARILSSQFDDSASQELARQHIDSALRNHGIDPGRANIEVRCHPNPDCTVLGETLTVTVHLPTPLPLTSDIADGWQGWQIPVESSVTFPRGLRPGQSTLTPSGSHIDEGIRE